MGFRVLMHGQDITAYTQELSIQIKDTLGQGAGVGGGKTGRASTCEFLTNLGPATSAVGSGTTIHSPQLVRQGEVNIQDSTGANIFGGYVCKLTDQTDKKQLYTLVDCYDYWQELDRYMVQEIYSGVSDVFMIKDLLTKYAPWVRQNHLPTFGGFNFTVKNFKAISLQKVLVAITDVTGYQIWIDAYGNIFYQNPLQASTAPFGLSTSPDNLHNFPLGVDSTQGLVIDDTAAINRVTFFGGKNPSNDFTQDLSTQANGSNRLFVLAFYPRYAHDGVFHINVQNIASGNDLVYGYKLGTTTKNAFKSKGGLADVLVNGDAHTLEFDPGAAAPINSGPNSVTMTYRYEFPMIIQLTDQPSRIFFGRYYDGVISDDTVFDSATAVARCRVLLNEQAKGLTTLKVSCWKTGIQAGQRINITHSARNISGTFMVQEVDTVPLGGGIFRYDITCGAWKFNVVDAILAATQDAYHANLAAVNDNNNGQVTNVLEITQLVENAKLSEVWSVSTRAWGSYYARSSPVGDGADAYSGLFSVKT